MQKYNKFLRNIIELVETGLVSSKDLKKENPIIANSQTGFRKNMNTLLNVNHITMEVN